jgi:hypothetical protein
MDEPNPRGSRMSEARLVAVLLAALSMAMLSMSLGLRPPAYYAPLAVLIPTTVLLVVELIRVWRSPKMWAALAPSEAPIAPITSRIRRARRVARGRANSADHRRELVFVAWLVALVVGVMILGSVIAVPAFLLAWLVVQARQSWASSVAVAGIAALVLGIVLPHALALRLPAGMLGQLIGL